MELAFTLKKTTGAQLVARFAAAIEEERVGYDEVSNATLSPEGDTWYTALSNFSYRVLNPKENNPAVVLYQGASRGFLVQNLLPEELREETEYAVVREGSALERHGVEAFEHSNASILAEAYGLLQNIKSNQEVANHRSREDRDPFAMALAAVEAARKVQAHFPVMGVSLRDRSGRSLYKVWTGHTEHHHNNNGEYSGDPAIFVKVRLGTEHATLEFSRRVWASLEQDWQRIVTRAVDWLNHVKPVMTMA